MSGAGRCSKRMPMERRHAQMSKKVSPVVGIIIVLVVAVLAVYLIVKYTSTPTVVERPTAVPSSSAAGPEGGTAPAPAAGGAQERGQRRGTRQDRGS